MSEEHEPINELNNTWQQRFALLKIIGADTAFIFKAIECSEFKAMSFADKQKLLFNPWAFFLGPFYYFAKGMHGKGMLILGCICLYATILNLFEGVPNILYWVPAAVLCSQLANFDYYRLLTQGEQAWGLVPKILSTFGAARIFMIISAAILITSSTSQYDEGLNEREKQINRQFSHWDGSHRGLESLIKQQMNDPDSYKHVETLSWDMTDHLVVKTTFRGRNAYGALVVNWIKAKADMEGNIIEVIESDP